MTRTLRLSDRLRAVFARARSIPGHELAKHQEPPPWEAEDYSESRVAAPAVEDPWETDPEYRRSTRPSAEISKLGGLPASHAAAPIDGRVGSTSGAAAAIPRPVALKELRPIEAAMDAQGQPLTISDVVRSPPELGQSSHNTITVADARYQPVSPTTSADENKRTSLRHLQANGLGTKIEVGSAAVEGANKLSEKLTPDERAKNKSLLYADERNNPDDAPGDENPEADLEEQTFTEVVEDLDFELKDEQVFLATGAIDELFYYDPDAHQELWGDGQYPNGSDEDGVRRAREKAATIASVVDITSRRDQETMLEWLTEFFLEFRNPATFRAIARVVDQSITPDLLRALIALRRYWMERPEWSVSRYDVRHGVHPLRRGSKGLGWAAALRVCRQRADYPAEDMIDDSWFQEWLSLPPGAPGYFLFAAYVDAKITDPDCELLHEGLIREHEYEDDTEMGDDRGWWRRLPRYDESNRFGFSVLTPFQDSFGPLGYPETQNRPKRSM